MEAVMSIFPDHSPSMPEKKALVRTFAMTDGTSRMHLEWHTDTNLPDFERTAVAAMRTAEAGIEWATAKVVCPHCAHAFRLEPASRRGSSTAAGARDGRMLDEAAVPLLEMLGNISIEPGAKVSAACPRCGMQLHASLDAKEDRIAVSVCEESIVVAWSGSYEAHFLPDGKTYVAMRGVDAHSASELDALLRMPGVIGVSGEAKKWIYTVLGIGPMDGTPGDEIDILGLALEHRFKGYGAEFASRVREYFDQLLEGEAHWEVVNSLFCLPRRCSDRAALEKLFAKSKLPDKPSVRRAAVENAAAFAMVAHYGLGVLCGGDPNVAVRLLASRRLDPAWVGSLLNKDAQMSDLVLHAAKQEKPAYLCKKLLGTSAAALASLVACYEGLDLGSFCGMRAYQQARRKHRLSAIIKRPGLLSAYADSSESVSINYGENAALQGSYDGFRFELPEHTGVFAAAGAELKNCLCEAHGIRAALGEALVMLVSKGSHLVAAIEMPQDGKEALQMLAKANRAIAITEDLGIAIAKWGRANNVALSGELFL